MKLTCTVEYLKNAVLTAERFTSRNITVPIISHILFLVKEKKISIIATNLEMGIEYVIPGKVQKQGVVTAPAKQLSHILQSFSNNEHITLSAEGGKLTLTTDHSTATILGLNPGDFPTLPAIKKEHTFSVALPLFTSALHQVVVASATTDLKPELTGVCMVTSPKTLTLVATDSFRLAEATLHNLDSLQGSSSCIIPLRTIQELLRTVPSDGDLDVSIGEHQVVFSWGETRILSRLIDGAYPPYKNLIPTTYETTIVVDQTELLKHIHLASVFSSRLNDVTLHYSPTELEVSTTNTETGSASGTMEVKGRGSSGTVVFNHRYLADGLTAAAGAETLINLNGVSGPTLIKNPQDASYLYLLMPIRSA